MGETSLGGLRLEGPLVRHGGKVAENEGVEHHWFEDPEVVSDKSDALFTALSLLVVKQIATAQKGLGMEEADIDPVDCGSLLVSVYNHALVDALHVRAESFGPEAGFHFPTLHNFDGVSIELPDGTDSDVCLVELVQEGPSGSLGPDNSSVEVMLLNRVLICLEPKTSHLYNYQIITMQNN